MKLYIRKLRYLLGGVAACSLGLASTAGMAGTIVGSPHDFSGAGWNNADQQICVACHTPHNAADPSVLTTAPLWNHAVTTQTFTMYSRSTLNGSITGQPDGVSLLCLSCHDGTVAVDSFGGATGTNFMGTINADANLGTDLSNDHPISITYNATTASADGALHDPTATNVTIGTGGDKTRTGTIATVMLSNGTVQCSSCHDVHNSFTVPDASGGFPLLKVSKNGSALCLTCHNK
jgi:hypothetical protein